MMETPAVSSRDSKGLRRREAYTLYSSHTLSAWNARSYEYAAVIFTAAAYPGGLRAASLLGLSNSIANICLGPAIGRWIEHANSRLQPLLISITINRLAVVFACAFWFLIVSGASNDSTPSRPDSETGSILQGTTKSLAFTILLCLGIIENLSRNANTISMERDWVPVLAPDTVITEYSLTQVNSTMARIDMACKMASPIAVSWFFSQIPSIRLGILCFALFNVLSLALEWVTAKRIYESSAPLRHPKEFLGPRSLDSTTYMSRFQESFLIFFGSKIWKASLAFCIMQASVLSITGVTVVFFLNSGYSLRVVTFGQILSAVFELTSTFVVPILVQAQASSRTNHGFELVRQGDFEETSEEDDKTKPSETQRGIRYIGFWGVIGMFSVLVPTGPILVYLTSHLQYPIAPASSSPTFDLFPVLSVVLIFCLAASRMGRGAFAIATQQLAQARVSSNQRSAFAGAEIALVSVFGMGHSIGTAVWSKPEQFGWLAFGSLVSISLSASLYSHWAWRDGMGQDR